jgi:DNA-binding NtrC family response regulator
MAEETMLHVLALVPHTMRDAMRHLHQAVTGSLTACATVEELEQNSVERTFEVVLIPSNNLPPQDWWLVWGAVRSMEPCPSILVYTEECSFSMWAGVLNSGGFDVVIAPYTLEKLRNAIASAAEEFARRTAVT